MAKHNSPRSKHNSQSAALIESAPAPEAVRALVWDCEAATQQWLDSRAPADIRTLAHFAQIGREWLAQCDHTDSPATRDYFQCSINEAMPAAQAALADRNSAPATPHVVTPVYPLFFLRMMEAAAREALHEWLTANAPAEIIALFQAMEVFECLQDMPDFCTAEESAHCIRDIAIVKKQLGLSDWPDFITTQPDETADGMGVAG